MTIWEFFFLSNSYILCLIYFLFIIFIPAMASVFSTALNKNKEIIYSYFISDFKWNAFNILSINKILAVIFFLSIPLIRLKQFLFCSSFARVI